MEKVDAATLLAKIEEGYSLPHLSPVAVRLVELAADENASADDLSDLLEKDPGLAIRVLRQANSAFFKSTMPVENIQQAVVRLGFKQIRIMALSLSLRDSFPMGVVGPLDYEAFWRTSLYKALLSKALGANLPSVDPDTLFTLGLIMEVGFLVLFDIFIRKDEEVEMLFLEPLPDLLTWERSRYGVDHRQVGKAVLTHWNFPSSIIGLQSFWGKGAIGEDAPLMVKVYETARYFSKVIIHDKTDLHPLYIMAEKVLGLNQEVVTDSVLTTFENVEEIARGLSLEMDKEKDLIGIMEKANRALGNISSLLPQKGEPADKPLPSFDSMTGKNNKDNETLQAVAHEIRNPLMIVGAFARKLAGAMPDETESGKYAKVIEEEALRLEKVLQTMMDS